MGGTTAKVAVVSIGVPAMTTYFELQRVGNRRGSGLPVDIPALDLVEVGTGGGSIAELREGTLRVGPRSAGADPGPACYGRGATAPTVTDANLLLGYYDPGVFAGGLILDLDAATAAINLLAEQLGIEPIEAAWGIHEIATTNMEHAIRLVSINRGFDPRKHVLVCTGGAAPAHGPRLARALGCKRAMIPLAASGGSARGLLEAAASTEVTKTALVRLDGEASAATCSATISEVLEEAERSWSGAGTETMTRLTLGMRYLGQGHELLVPIEPDVREPAGLAERFHERYESVYGYRDEQPVEVATWHVSLARRAHAPTGALAQDLAVDSVRAARRAVYFPETGMIEVDVHPRARMREGDVVEGPCLVAEPTTTTVVLPGDRAEVVAGLSLLIHIAP
jgi:N-methylhydantoinase A/oxoprolinase/acetone carboxylase beta subunit